MPLESSEPARDSNDGAVSPPIVSQAASIERETSPRSQEGPRIEHDLDLNLGRNKVSEVAFQSTVEDEGPRPPLPPRPANKDFLQPGGSLQRPIKQSRPNLQSSATTALSLADIHTQSHQDGLRESSTASVESTPPGKSVGGFGSIRRFKGRNGSEGDDSASVRSYAPTLEVGGDVESLLGDILGSSQQSPGWKLLSSRVESSDPFDTVSYEDDTTTAEFESEFDELDELDSGGKNEGRGQSISLCSCLTFIKRNYCHFGEKNENISSFFLPPESLSIIVTEMTT